MCSQISMQNGQKHTSRKRHNRQFTCNKAILSREKKHQDLSCATFDLYSFILTLIARNYHFHVY